MNNWMTQKPVAVNDIAIQCADTPAPQEEDRRPPLPPRPGGSAGRRVRGEKRIPIALIDRRPLTRASVAQLLEANAWEFSTRPLSRAAELLDSQSRSAARVGLVVFSIGAASAAEEWVHEDLRLLNSRLPDVPVVVISDRDEIDYVMEALRRGVRGYIPTTHSLSVMIEALRLVHAGGTFIPASALVKAIEAQELLGNGQALKLGEDAGAAGFTRRELQVLALLRQGKPNKIIAYELAMQESTVKVHVRHIMRKLNATNRTQAAFLARQPLPGESDGAGRQGGSQLGLGPETDAGPRTRSSADRNGSGERS